MARKWGVERLNMSKSSDNLEPLPAPLLTASEVRRRRLELAEEMVQLVLAGDELAARPRQVLQKVFASLGTVRRQL